MRGGVEGRSRGEEERRGGKKMGRGEVMRILFYIPTLV